MRILIAAATAALCTTLLSSPATAQPGEPTCKTDAVVARIADLEARIRRYEGRLAGARQELAPLQAAFDKAKAETQAAREQSGYQSPEYKSALKVYDEAYDKAKPLRERVAKLQQQIDGFRADVVRLSSLPPCGQNADAPVFPVAPAPAPRPAVLEQPQTPEPPRSRIRSYPTLAGLPGASSTTEGVAFNAGVNVPVAFTSNDYDHARFDGAGPGIGGQFGARWNFSTGWMAGAEVGGTALAVTASHSEGPFVDMNWQIWEMVQIGFNTQAFGSPVTLYAGVGATQARFVVGFDNGVFRDAMRDTLGGIIARGAVEYGVLPGVSMGFAYQYSHFDGRVEHEPVKADVHAVMLTANFELGRVFERGRRNILP